MTKATQLFPPSIPRIDVKSSTHRNHDGAVAFQRSLGEQVLQVLLTGTFDNRFYTNQTEQIESARDLFTGAIAADPEFFSKALVYAREHGYMRTLPTYGLALLTFAPAPHFENAIGRVLRTPDDMGDFLIMLGSVRQGQGSRRHKRAIARWLRDNISEYWAMKYAHATRQKRSADEGDTARRFALRDMLRVSHPRFGPEGNAIVAYILGKNKFAEGLPQVLAYEALKIAKTEEDRARLIREGRLPHNVATLYASGIEGDRKAPSKVVWRAIAEQMPAFALLKHLRSLEQSGVLDDVRATVERKLTDPRVIRNSKILPYRFLDAMDAVSSGWAKDVCRKALELSFENAPTLTGRTAILVDVSPSMKTVYSTKMGQFTKVASIMAVALMKKANLNGRLILFGGTAREMAVSMEDSILTQSKTIVDTMISATNHSAGIDLLIERGDRVDNIVLITDGEHNTGRPFAQSLNDYRRKVNPSSKVFVVDVSDYRDAVAPQEAEGVYYVYGWSDRVLAFIALTTQGWTSIADAVRAGAFDKQEISAEEVYSGEIIA